MNVAIVKLSSLGDIVHALPVASALRSARPHARISWLVEARHAPVLAGHPAITDVIVVDTRQWRRARTPVAIARALGAIGDLRRQLRAHRFDVAVDLQANLKGGVVTFATGAPTRIGFVMSRCRERADALFTNRRVLPSPRARHVVGQYLSLLGALGIDPPARGRFDLPVDAAAEHTIDAALAAAGLKPRDRLVILNPGAGRAGKKWPVEQFAELATRIARDGVGRVMTLWGPGELDAAEAISRGGRAVLAPATDIPGLVALLRRTSVLVAADTGPLHIAAALGVPCVGLFGPTSAIRNGPYGDMHRTLQAPDGRVASIEVAAVLHAVTETLA